MKIGVCSTDFEPNTIDGIFQKMAFYGFHATQFSYVSIGEDEMLKDVNEDMVQRILVASKKYDVEIVAVNATFNMVDANEQTLQENIRRMEVMCKTNQMLGCNILTLCTGSMSTDNMWKYHPDNELETSWAKMVGTMERVVRIADKYKMYLALETEASNIVSTPEKARCIMDQIGYKRLKMIIDCANLFHVGSAHRENVTPIIQHAFECFGKDIILAHGKDIAESDGIDFAPVGEGIIDYDLFLQLLKKYSYKGNMVLHGIYKETLMTPSVEFIRRKILENGFN